MASGRWRAFWWAVLLSGAFVPRSSALAAEPTQVTLGWARFAGAEACVDSQKVQMAVERRLGRPAFAAHGEHLAHIEVRLRRLPAADRWHATIVVARLGKVLGRREVEQAGTDCGELEEALHLVLALVIDAIPDWETRLTTPGAIEHESLASPATVDAKPTRRVRLSLGVGAQLVWGLVPGVAVGANARATLRTPWLWPVDLSFTAWNQTETRVPDGGSAFVLRSVALSLCPDLPLPQLSACVGALGGWVRARGFGFAQSRTQTETVLAFGGNGRWHVPLGRVLSLQVGVGAWWSVRRHRYVYQRDAMTVDLYQAPALAVAGYFLLHFSL